ncbi:UvrD-helicase domain-containing protein [uncultured Desulfosarcina sp.]|uniref:UvrD-helicase domain-containing protein n=1 Tax=uncultured Desulfosarcina sp. TaxID=218289 RepID=UPI0029C8EFBB|nr:UvrD-helicase domain-containing protein [uncultured Desulfosarcina sp.]
MTFDPFIADLHVHSKFSRATSRNLDIEHLYIWAQRKGIRVVGTGDFTHPQWFSLIEEKLEPAEPGLYRLKKEIARYCDEKVPPICRSPVRFLLSSEISNIYKKKDRTRKNHNLVFFPEIEDVRRFNAKLDAIGNINSDGRPILGLDAHDLLEIALEISQEGFFVPAHIWTPWFSMLGSKSGFDSIEECFGDLSPHIFAAETGLSSDPAMNWRVAGLDPITLISNSDAHSPAKLGREANIFTTELNFYSMRAALESGDRNQFGGTFEFYPEEGKYHVDGHRKCSVFLKPAETKKLSGKCPVCGKPLTLGVLHRVEDLATRDEGIRPERAFPFFRLIPLEDLLSEIFQVGAGSKKVQQTYRELLNSLGSEFDILHAMSRDRIETAGVLLLGEAIERMRDNRVTFSPGYDGLFGTVKIFSDGERQRLLGQRTLFSSFESKIESTATIQPALPDGLSKTDDSLPSTVASIESTVDPVIRLNSEQQAAVAYSDGPLMIIAGPGTGKTRTLTQKIARLVQNGGDGQRILAVTFTNKAATEMQDRLRVLLGEGQTLPFVGTFHALGYRILASSMDEGSLTVVDEKTRMGLAADALAINGVKPKKDGFTTDDLIARIVEAKQKMLASGDDLNDVCPQHLLPAFTRCYATYEHLLQINNLADFEDLIFRSIHLLEKDPSISERYKGFYTDIFVDEYQDINAGQYRLVRLLAGDKANMNIIGDPDQSIYGFRGSEMGCFAWFEQDYPTTRTLFLTQNYRSTQTILEVSTQIIGYNPQLSSNASRKRVYSDVEGRRTIELVEAETDKSEAVAIGKTIEKMVGGTGFFSLDSGAVDGNRQGDSFGFSDFAVLFRTRSQAEVIETILEKAGIPCQRVDRRTVLEHSGIQSIVAAFKVFHGVGLFDDIAVMGKIVYPPPSTKALEILKRWAYHNELSVTEALSQARRLPIPKMGNARQQRLFEFTNQLTEYRRQMEALPVARRVAWIYEKAGFDQKLTADAHFETGYRQLMATAETCGNDAAAFLAALALSSNTDIYDHRVEKVSLTTMHAAKGLEFPVVFIAGCEDTWMPYSSAKRPADPEEERRLFYVALTRAKRHLVLTKANRRRINGKSEARQWSPFIKEIEESYKRYRRKSLKKAETPVQQQLSLF